MKSEVTAKGMIEADEMTMPGQQPAMPGQELPESADVLIIGSGPAGATFARLIRERVPDASILMVDVGPRLTERAGENARNLEPAQRDIAEHRSQGPDPAAVSSPTGSWAGRLAARPGTFLVRSPALASGTQGADAQAGMPAAAMSSNVGGMSAHWTCACPAPGGRERISFLPSDRFDAAFATARDLLAVTAEGFQPTAVSEHALKVLGGVFDAGRAPDRVVQPMPLACRPTGSGLPHWSGAAEVLGPLAMPGAGGGRFTLAAETICRRLVHSGGRVSGAELEHLPSGRQRTVRARAVVVAADALRTPQLLWASGIRPAALGHYLNDQPQIMAAVIAEQPDSVTRPRPGPPGTDQPDAPPQELPADVRDQLTGVLWVPFDDLTHPFHGQVMQLDAAPIVVAGPAESSGLTGLGWFTTKELRFQDRVEFSDEDTDGYGMPAMTIRYDLTARDLQSVQRATASLRQAAAALGPFAPGGEPHLLPAGSSMHYQGSFRMGKTDDGTSVCDPGSRVWGFSNLYVAGNGVIPTAIACNPTATAVALAVIATDGLAEQLASGPPTL